MKLLVGKIRQMLVSDFHLHDIPTVCIKFDNNRSNSSGELKKKNGHRQTRSDKRWTAGNGRTIVQPQNNSKATSLDSVLNDLAE